MMKKMRRNQMKNKLIVLFVVLLLTVSLASAVDFPKSLGKYKLESKDPGITDVSTGKFHPKTVKKADGNVVPIKAIYIRPGKTKRRTYLDENGKAIAWSYKDRAPEAFKKSPGTQDKNVQNKLASYNSPKAGKVNQPKDGKGPTVVSYKDGNGEPQTVNIPQGIKVPKGVKNVKVSKDGNAQIVEYSLGTGANKKNFKISTEGPMSVATENDEVTQFAFGGKPISKSSDGTWLYGGTTYEGVKAAGGTVTLNNPGKSVTLSSANGVATEKVKQGNVETTTNTFLDGSGRSVTTKEGKKESTVWVDSKGNLLSRYTDDGKNKGRVYYDLKGNPTGFCGNCQDKNDKPLVTFNKAKCTADQYKDPDCYTKANGDPVITSELSQLKPLSDAVYEKAFNEGSLSSQYAQGLVFGGQRFSALPLSQQWEWYGNWVKDADNFFSTSVLGVEYYESKICEEYLFKIDTGENIAVIKTSGDTLQFIGHIEAERMDVSPLICQQGEEEDYCPGDLTCAKDGFCYEEGSKTPAAGFLYKLSWGVTAPADEKFLQYSGQAGAEIKFNVKAVSTEGDFYLFQDADGNANKNTIHLKKGQRSEEKFAPMIVDYSTVPITSFCIEFADGHRPADLDGDPVNDLCTEANDAVRKRTLAESTGGSPSNTGEVKFCGFSKCS
jgi:hypothetical protein